MCIQDVTGPNSRNGEGPNSRTRGALIPETIGALIPENNVKFTTRALIPKENAIGALIPENRFIGNGHKF